jgi:DNA polymerase (family 10)
MADPWNFKTPFRRVDIFFRTSEEYPGALLHFTGSAEYSKRLREKAKRYGLKLNDKGLFEGKLRLPLDSEKEIVERLQEEYVPPENRN